MNPLMITTYIKWGIYAIVGLLFSYVIWSINHTYSENRLLKQDAIIQEANVKTLKDDVEIEKQLNVSLQARVKEVQAVTKERIVYVDRVKKGDTIYVNSIKKEIEYIKQNAPETLDQYYISKYNSILDCIMNTTDTKDLLCATQ